MRGRDVRPQLLDQPREAGRLALGQVEHQAGERGRVDDRMLERALEAATDEPGIEGVVAVLDEHRPLGEAQKRAARVLELRRADEHRTVDVMAPSRVGVDGSATVDERVEERQRPVETEPLGADLEDEEGRVAGRLHVEGDELRVGQRRPPADLRRVDRDLVPGHRLNRASRLEEQSLGAHVLACARARRAHAISSPVRARRSTAATA